MMRRSIRSSFLILAGAAAGLGFGLTQAASAAVVISDTFTNNTTDRASGKTLNKVEAESGNATWGASRFAFTSDNSVTSSNTGASAWVPTPSITDTVTVEADVDPSTLGTGDWSAIYLTNTTTTGGGVYGNFQLVMNLSKNGTWGVFVNGTGHKIAHGSVTLVTGFNHLALTYHPADKKLDAAIDGTAVLSDYNIGTFDPDIKTAGMFINGDGSTFDNFKLTVVPEPAAIGSLVIGGVLVLKNRPKRK